MKPYELGGYHFIIVNDEVYVRYSDVYEADDEEVPPPATEQKRGRKAGKAKGKRKCGKCGEIGHNAKTCGGSDAAPKDGKTLEELVQKGIDAGEGYEEICMTYPNIPAAAIHKVYKELAADN